MALTYEQQDFIDGLKTKKAANLEIAKRIEQIITMHEEMVYIANEYGLDFSFSLDLPNDIRTGHNQENWISWNESSKYC